MSEYSSWIMAEIKSVCIRYKRRIAGSQSVRDCLAHMSEQLSPWCDSVEKEAVSFHPHAFIGSIAQSAVGDIAGTVCFWIAYWTQLQLFLVLSLVFFSVTLVARLGEYGLYLRIFDFLYPRRQSENVFAVRRASGETHRRIIICGHADTAYEMPFFMHMKSWMIYLLIFAADGGMMASMVFAVLALAAPLSQSVLLTFAIIEAVLLLAYIPFLFFVKWRTITDGANDNLSGCFLGMSIIKEMADNNERLTHTDLCCLITDGEESGLRGALAYAKAHRQELIDSNTIVIAADTIHDPQQLMIYHRGINFTQKNDLEVCELLHQAGLACGVDLPYTDFYPGANDSEAFSRYGIKAAAICAVSHQPSDYYHTRYDSWDNLDESCIDLTREILKQAVILYDQGGAAKDAASCQA